MNLSGHVIEMVRGELYKKFQAILTVHPNGFAKPSKNIKFLIVFFPPSMV